MANDLFYQDAIYLNGVGQNCSDGVQWIMNIFKECVEDNEELVGFAFGIVSLFLWILPIFPQLLENYRLKSCEGLSIYFILFWVFGDSTNLIGAVLTHQLPLQIWIAFYYIFADFLLLSQFVYYSTDFIQLQRRIRRSIHFTGAVLLTCMFCLTFIDLTEATNIQNNTYNLHTDIDYSPHLHKQFFDSGTDEIGYAIGSISALLYFSGRVPQLLKNYKRQSTEGVSLSTFVIIVLANLTYGLSVFMGGHGSDYILHHLPWLIGSLGCCTLDFLVIAQYFIYLKRNALPIPESYDDDDQECLLRASTSSEDN